MEEKQTCVLGLALALAHVLALIIALALALARCSAFRPNISIQGHRGGRPELDQVAISSISGISGGLRHCRLIVRSG